MHPKSFVSNFWGAVHIDGIIRANPKQKKFRNGWLNRLACIQYGCLKYTTDGKTLTTFQFSEV